jgi:hypothetical protein
LDISLKVERTLDTGYCYEVLTNKHIFDCVTEDGATVESFNVDVIKDYWLEITDKDIDIGVFQMKQMLAKCYEAHIHILPEYRKDYADGAGELILKWIKDNIKECLLVTRVPALFPNVKDFLLRHGFEQTGVLPNAHCKNGKQHDMWILTRGIK